MIPAAAACDICRSPATQRQVGAHQVLVCSACGFGRVLTDHATGDYWDRRDDLDGELGDSYWTTARTGVFTTALRQLAGQVTGRTLLDVGGGVGHFTACALGLGWDAYSLDVSPSATELARVRLGADRALSVLPEALVGACDVVTLWCVAAHVPDPRPVIDEAVRALRPGGRLFLTTPNFRFQAGYSRLLALGGRPLDFLAHDHVLHFTPTALRLLLNQAGLAVDRFSYIGVTEDCLLDRRLATLLVPAKRLWNWTAVQAARCGLPLLSSELQVVATVPVAETAVLVTP